MAVGQTDFPMMPPILGIQIGTTNAGIKQIERDDLLVFQFPETATCAAVFTQNAFCAAPVHLAKANLSHSPRWLLINSGNANAGTGKQGMIDAQQTCEDLAQLIGGKMQQVLPFSTGVIGQSLPVEKIKNALPKVVLNLVENQWEQAARAIMTTDTFPKGVSKVIVLNGENVTINGISKGAGMIKPNMATMLGYIATDIGISQTDLNALTKTVADQSFNCISIDGDTSTNDSFIIMATGKSGLQVQKGMSEFAQFAAALQSIATELAQLIVRDGEGATKFIAVNVVGGGTEKECQQVAYAIAHSPLVKTAFFASDPNLGRILAAVGYAGIADLDQTKIDLHLDDVLVAESGGRNPSYREEDGQRVMKQSEITVRVNLNRGAFETTVWTCDFSYDYVKINADYRS